MKKLLHEPLFHFLIIGAIIFTLFSSDVEDEREIIITEGKIAQLKAVFNKTRQRDPDLQELQDLIDDVVHQEIAFDQAEALGLVEDDAIVKRRIKQKMEYLIEDSLSSFQVSDEVLQAYMDDHQERYAFEPLFTFSQIYFDPNKHDDTDSVMEETLKKTDSQPLEDLGDGIMLEEHYSDISLSQIARLFGGEFAEALRGLPLEVWQKDISSGYGVHLVRIEGVSTQKPAALDEVRALVLRDYQDEKRQTAVEAFYVEASKHYRVIIEGKE